MNKTFYLKTLFILLLFFYSTSPILPQGSASFVWTNADSRGRLQVAWFRYAFDWNENIAVAELNLFADSRYHLLVNGHFIDFGPARFYPEHPEYDTFDLKPYLQKGQNVIAVKVMSNGVSTFQLRRHQAGFIAWGKIISTTGRQMDLSTPGNWLCHQSQGYAANAARMTFALGPMEIYDARKDQAMLDWEKTEFDASNWQKPVKLSKQDAWGKLAPRSIPHLTAEMYQPRQLLGVYNWRQDEDHYSFQLLEPDQSREEFRTASPFFGYTYIFSPQEQDVEAGVSADEHFLNGQGPLEKINAGADRPHRQQVKLHLQKGWNYFFVPSKSFFGKWAFNLALPNTAGLQLSPDQKQFDPVFFRTTGALPEEAWEKCLTFAGLDPGEKKGFQWIDHRTADLSGNPAIEMAWRYFSDKIPAPDWQIDDITVNDTTGTSLVYDFRYKKLARILIDYEAPAGTILDVGITEDLLGEQANVMKRNGLYMATRHISAGGNGRMETFKPYGLRYLQIDVHGNSGPVRIKTVRVMQHVYPFEQVGQFECSDPAFNDIWQVGWRTLQVCAEDSYTDTPFRERGLYAGDMLPQIGVTLAGSSDLRLVKRSLLLFQDMYIDQFNPGVPPHPDEISLLEDYPLLTLEAMAWYLDRTGDLAFAKALFPAYERLLNTLFAQFNDQGLLHNNRVFIEWTQIEKTDLSNTAYHAILIRSCELMARLATQLAYPDKANFYQKKQQELAAPFRQNFWNETLGRFSDGIKAGKQIDHYYAISSAWPYLSGLTDSLMDQQIFPYIAAELQSIGEESRRRKITPYGSFYVLGALYDQGYADVAERFMRQYWFRMIDRHNDTAWENFDDVGIGTLSHAWSGAPTYYLTTQVLGVNLGWPHPTDPDELVIAPQSATLRWAKGVVPHPKGVVKVSWEIRGNVLWMECKAPEGVNWRVEPRGRLANLELWVNGEKY